MTPWLSQAYNSPLKQMTVIWLSFSLFHSKQTNHCNQKKQMTEIELLEGSLDSPEHDNKCEKWKYKISRRLIIN